MDIKYIDIEMLTNHPRNPRVLKNDQYVKALNEMSKMSWKWLNPIVINTNHIIDGKYVILSGNQRVSIAKILLDRGLHKFKELPTIDMKCEPESKQEHEIMVKMNKSWGEWDWGELANMDFDMNEFCVDLFFEPKDLSKGFEIDLDEVNRMIQGTELSESDKQLKDEKKKKGKLIICPECGCEIEKNNRNR